MIASGAQVARIVRVIAAAVLIAFAAESRVSLAANVKPRRTDFTERTHLGKVCKPSGYDEHVLYETRGAPGD